MGPSPLSLASFYCLLMTVIGFVVPPPSLLPTSHPHTNALSALSSSSTLSDLLLSLPLLPSTSHDFSVVGSLSSPLLITQASTTESWVAPVALGGDIFLNLLSLLMLCRVVISWYPKTDLTSFPYSVCVFPTEWLLRPTRGIVPPAFGVDVSPIVWLAISTFLHEIFLGQQVRHI